MGLQCFWSLFPLFPQHMGANYDLIPGNDDQNTGIVLISTIEYSYSLGMSCNLCADSLLHEYEYYLAGAEPESHCMLIISLQCHISSYSEKLERRVWCVMVINREGEHSACTFYSQSVWFFDQSRVKLTECKGCRDIVCYSWHCMVFIGTCTGRGHVQWARPRPSLESSPFASVSSTNGSSFEEILKELDVQYVFVG